MKFPYLLLAMITVTLAGGCAPTLHVRADFDHAVDFTGYHTFRLEDGRFMSDGMRLEGSLAKDRIDNALRRQLAVEGLAPSGRDPDLIVRYVAGVRSVQQLQSYGYPIGVLAVPNTNVWVQEFPEGLLVIDLVDAQTNKLVWRVSCRATGEGFDKQAVIDKSIAKAFEKFPPRPS